MHLRHSRVYCVYAHFLLFKKLSDPPCKIEKKQLYWKEAPTQLPVFSCKIHEIFKKKIFYKIPPVAASDTFTLVFIYDFLLHIPSIIFRGAADPWSIWEYRWKPFWLNLSFDQQSVGALFWLLILSTISDNICHWHHIWPFFL